MLIYRVLMNDRESVQGIVTLVVISHENHLHANKWIKDNYETDNCKVYDVLPIGRAFSDDQDSREVCCNSVYR